MALRADASSGPPGRHGGFVSVRTRLVVTTFMLSLGLVMLSLGANGFLLRHVARERAKDTANVLATLISHGVSAGLDFESHSSVRNALADAFKVDAVRFVSVAASGGEPFEQLGVLPDQPMPRRIPDRIEMTWTEGLLIAHAPVRTGEGRKIGAVHVGYSLAEMQASVQRGVLMLLLAGFLLALLGSTLTRRFGSSLTAPILELAAAARRVAEGRFEKPLPIHKQDEVGVVTHAFNDMVLRLEESRVEIERQNRELERKVGERTTELRQKNLELAMQNEKVMEASRLKSAFLANMSHELRTPLNAILALSELLRDEVLGPLATDEQRRQVGMIHRSGENLLSLINEVLDLSKIEAGRMQIQSVPTDVRELLRASAEQVAGLARSKAIELRFSFEGEGSVWIDPDRIRQVFHNLVGNAIKFTDHGWVEIRCRLDPDAEQLTIAVRDTGIGIAPEDHERIFHEFRQVDGSVTRRFGGTGLGLAICRRLAHLMGGTIRVESALGKGSTFTFQVPAHRQRPETPNQPWEWRERFRMEPVLPDVEAGGGEAFAEAPLPSAEPEGAERSHGCVLVVDDDEVLLEALVRYLAREGLEVKVARNGFEALAEMERRRPDLMVLDLMMPGMSGFEVIESLRQQSGRPKLPVLVFTAKELTRKEWLDLEQSVEGILRKGSGGVRLLLEDIRRIVGAAAPGDRQDRPAA